MSYNDFTIRDLKTSFGLNFIEKQNLFADVGVYDVPQYLSSWSDDGCGTTI